MNVQRLLQTLFLFVLFGTSLHAQVTVKGMVSSEEGEPLAGVSVRVTGSNLGTTTGIDGTYSISAPDGAEIMFSYTGYASKSMRSSGNAPLNIVLSESALLDEVVVTALGISREKKSLTYAATEVGGDEVQRVKDPNVINALSGKVAGVQINRSASGVGGSTRVVLRGNKSTRDNQVLYVIDGVPMFNFSPAQPSDIWGQANGSGSSGRDGGDAISNLNPEDIESLTVLRGASAAALYGSQAANGVILVTTKKGKSGSTQVDFNSNLTFESPVYLPELQFTYGQTAAGAQDSWGNKVNAADHVKGFFQTGQTWINSVALSGGNKTAQTYFSYANTNASGIIPTSSLQRHNVTLRETATFFNNRLDLGASLNYTNQKGENRASSGLYYNALTGLYFFPRGLNFDTYKTDYEVESRARNTKVQNWIADNDNQQNPYWILNRNPNYDVRNRYLGAVTAKLKITSHLALQARGNYDRTFDTYDHRSFASTQGTLADANGRYILQQNEGAQRYGDLILMYGKSNDNISFNANIGTSTAKTKLYTESFDSKGAGGGVGLNFANVFSIQNIKQPGADFSQRLARQDLQSVFGSFQVGYQSKIYLDVTGRNDWSSTLAFTDNNSFFYPSVGLTGILSEMLNIRSLDFWKVRASYAQVGNAVIPYDTNPLNRISSVSGLSINTVGPLPDTDLKPEVSKSLEIGTDIRFWGNRVGLDLTWYKTNTTNQRLSISAPFGSGFTQYIINAGDIQNSGIEALLNITPVQGDKFNWNTSFNFTRNVNEVKKLDDRLADGTFVVTGAGVNNYAMVIQEGGSFGDIQGMKFARDAQGRIIIDKDGKPTKDKMGIVGNPNPDFMLGWSNSLTYGPFSLNLLIDGRFGGEVMSITQAMIDELGVSQASADARDAGSYAINGAKADGSAVSSIDPKTFFQTVGGRAGITENYVYDATNIRFRELAIGYRFPKSVVNNWGPVKGLRLSFVARNLGFLTKKAPFDPELSMSTGTGLQGVDSFAQPAVRSFGLNLNATF